MSGSKELNHTVTINWAHKRYMLKIFLHAKHNWNEDVGNSKEQHRQLNPAWSWIKKQLSVSFKNIFSDALSMLPNQIELP